MKISETTRDKVQKYSQTIFCVLACFLLICIVILVSLAGMVVFIDGWIWKKQLDFIKVFEFIPAFMYVFRSGGGVPKKYKEWSLMLFLLCNFQYYTVTLAGCNSQGISPFHIYSLIISGMGFISIRS